MSDDADNDADRQERRYAELEFVSSAYDPELEAWHDKNATGEPVIHRLLPLKCGKDEEEIAATIHISLTMPPSYPTGQESLKVTAHIQNDDTYVTSSDKRLRKAALDSIPSVVTSAQKVADENVGAEAVFLALSRVEEWVTQGEWSKKCKSWLNESISGKDDEQSFDGDRVLPNVIFGRRLIYSHHIISKVKRADIKSLASDHQLTGYMKIGWPGLLIIEGREEDCIAFYDTIRRWNWQYLVVRGEQQDELVIPTTADEEPFVAKHREFDQFQEVDDMSLVAQHCREVGLEALFRTSMKVYDNAKEPDKDKDIAKSNLHGCLILVDHMNDAKGYRKWLRKTAKETHCHLMIKQCYPKDNYSRRPKIVVAVVGATTDDVSLYMKRWRTSRVDMDSRGKPCLERQMTVLLEGPLSPGAKSYGTINWQKAMAEDAVTTSELQLLDILQDIGGLPWKNLFESQVLDSS